jgi:ABC-type ATPase involved in cell division
MEKKSRILEVAGPAGAGKSSLVSLLKKRNNGIRTDFIFQKIKYLPFFISSLPLLFRTFLYRFRNTRWFTWQEIKDLVYLKTLLHDIGRQASGDQTVIVLDQGPIF